MLIALDLIRNFDQTPPVFGRIRHQLVDEQSDGLDRRLGNVAFDGGPTYVTLIWEVLRMRVRGSVPKLQNVPEVSLIGARAESLVKLKGNFDRDPFGDIKLSLSADEGQLMVASLTDAQRAEMRENALNDDDSRRFSRSGNPRWKM